MPAVKTSRKYVAAVSFIEANEDLQKALRMWKQMLPVTLYAGLAGLGVRWDTEQGQWYRKVQANLDPARNGTKVAAKTGARRDKVLMRIITHKAVRDVVVSEIVELIEALNYTVDSVSGGYENADGDFVRTYINLRRSTATD